MYCIALELDTKTNKILFDKAQSFVKKGKFYMINKFHFTVITLDDYPTEKQISEIVKFNWKNIYFSTVQELEGKNTAMNYLALNLELETELNDTIDDYRRKYMENKYFPLIPHVSLLQTEDVFLDEDIRRLDDSFKKNTLLGIKSILIYGPDRKIVKKIPI